MKYNIHQKQVIRTPIESFKTSFSLAQLRAFFSQSQIQEALFLASPSLYEECIKWVGGIILEKDAQRVVSSLYKYAIRMHTRCTPFGMFAGCSIGTLGGAFQIDGESVHRKTKLDMYYSAALAIRISTLPFVTPHLKFYPNSSLYTLADSLRYIEYKYKNNRRIYQIVSVENSEHLTSLLNKARMGVSYINLSSQLINDWEVSKDDAEEFLNELIDSQILVSELEPAAVGADPILHVISVLERIFESNESLEVESTLSLLYKIVEQLQIIDKEKIGQVSLYKEFADLLDQFGVPFEIDRLFQCDYFRDIETINAEETKNAAFAEKINGVLNLLNVLSPPSGESNLNRFREGFLNRYEFQEIPLAEALDNELGIGYGKKGSDSGDVNPLINDIMIPKVQPKSYRTDWTEISSILLNKYVNAKAANSNEIEFTDNDIKGIEVDWNDVPNSMTLFYDHIGKSGNEDLYNINYIGNATATFLIGRFAWANQDIGRLVEDIVNIEESYLSQDTILAEIAHLPENRMGNVISRPISRKYHIPYLSGANIPEGDRINIEDLLISIRDGRIVLRSKRLNKFVIPRMGNAHNFGRDSLPIYHFLCDMQAEAQRSLFYFNWGGLLNEFVYFPRVRYQNFILSPAIWQLNKPAHYAELCKDIKEQDLMDAVRLWKEKFNLPDLILLSESDNDLLINLQEPLSVAVFLGAIKKKEKVLLKEFLFNPNDAAVKDQKGQPYVNQIVGILTKNAGKNQAPLVKQPKGDNDIKRQFSLGSEWLYYKIYCGIKTSDLLLKQPLRQCIEELIDLRQIHGCFFIRYADPDFHIRLRFHLIDEKFIAEIIKVFNKHLSSFEANGLIRKIQIDTYIREIERYDPLLIKMAEGLFMNDSAATISMMVVVEDDEDLRWNFAIRSIDSFLEDFELNLSQKYSLMELLKNSYEAEFNANSQLKNQINIKYRKHTTKIEGLLNMSASQNSLPDTLSKILLLRGLKDKEYILAIKEIIASGSSQRSANELLSSYVHMIINRIFRSNQRMHELVIYSYLWKYYKSALAREKVSHAVDFQRK